MRYIIEMRQQTFDPAAGETVITDTHKIVGDLEPGQTLSDMMDLYQRAMPGWIAGRGQIVEA